MSDNLPPNNQSDDNMYQDPYSSDSDDYGYEQSEVESGNSLVATAKAKSIAIFVIIGIASIFFIYKMLFEEEPVISDEEKEKLEEQRKNNPSPVRLDNLGEKKNTSSVDVEEEEKVIDIEKVAVPPSAEVIKIESAPTIIVPDAPESIDMIAPPEPPSPTSPVVTVGGGAPSSPGLRGNIAPILFGEDAVKPERPSGSSTGAGGLTESEQAEIARRSAGSLITDSGGSGGGSASGGGNVSLFSSAGNDDDDAQFSAVGATATKVNRLNKVIIQGKMISAVLETAINTDLEGMLRAVVTHDVYSEKGRNILIPRGSRLIGSYESTVTRNQQRLQVAWSRVIRPDGGDIAIDSQGTDRLGRTGISGKIDNKYFELFGSSLLVSSVTTGVALIAEQFSDSEGVSSTITEGGTQETNGNISDVAISDAVQNLGSVGRSISDELLDSQPTFTVDQGAIIKIYVSKDLYFPEIY